jgi:hypothetical protein
MSARRELALGLGVYATYLLGRHLVDDERGRRRAERNAERVVALERRVGLDVDPRILELLVRPRRLCQALIGGYE